MIVPDEKGLPRHVLVLHDAVRNEVTGTCDRLSDGCLAVGKVDPLQDLDDLIAVENVEIKARHASETVRFGERLRPRLEDAALQAYIRVSVAARTTGATARERCVLPLQPA